MAVSVLLGSSQRLDQAPVECWVVGGLHKFDR